MLLIFIVAYNYITHDIKIKYLILSGQIAVLRVTMKVTASSDHGHIVPLIYTRLLRYKTFLLVCASILFTNRLIFVILETCSMSCFGCFIQFSFIVLWILLPRGISKKVISPFVLHHLLFMVNFNTVWPNPYACSLLILYPIASQFY